MNTPLVLIRAYIKALPRFWPLTWIFIFALITIIGLCSPVGHLITFIKLSGIILCFLYAISLFPKDNLLHLTLFITILADIILAINNTALPGLILFLVVQTLHTVRLSWSKLKGEITIFICIATFCILGNFLLHLVPSIYIISTFYVIALVTNILICWRWRTSEPKNPHALFGLLGFLSFLCCDICTGFSYLSLSSALPAFLYAPANFFAWFFYYPSQVFVSNSPKIPATTGVSTIKAPKNSTPSH